MRESNNKDDEPQAAAVPMPKHIQFPDFPGTSEILNELIMFLFVTCTAAMQFINIYRTNWWLPKSLISNTVNHFHIDAMLVLFIIVMNARRLLYCVSLKCLNILLPSHLQRMLGVFKYIIEYALILLIVACMTLLYSNHNYYKLLLLIYPIIVYFMVFGLTLEPLLRFNYEIKGSYFNGFPLHCCSANPNAIRDEIDVLRNDVNCRFKQVLFTATLNAYYSGFLPCSFANGVHYNVLWATQHMVLVFLSVLTMSTLFSFPSKYSDILHRASLHLGYWLKLELSPGADCVIGANSSNWLKTNLWGHNSVVRYNGDLYRSFGPVSVAQPSNVLHARFYKLFHNPSMIYATLTMIQTCVVFSGIFLLYYSTEWNFVLSLSFITLTNQFTFFKLMRDYLITKRIYFAESNVSDMKALD